MKEIQRHLLQNIIFWKIFHAWDNISSSISPPQPPLNLSSFSQSHFPHIAPFLLSVCERYPVPVRAPLQIKPWPDTGSSGCCRAELRQTGFRQARWGSASVRRCSAPADGQVGATPVSSCDVSRVCVRTTYSRWDVMLWLLLDSFQLQHCFSYSFSGCFFALSIISKRFIMLIVALLTCGLCYAENIYNSNSFFTVKHTGLLMKRLHIYVHTVYICIGNQTKTRHTSSSVEVYVRASRSFIPSGHFP